MIHSLYCAINNSFWNNTKSLNLGKLNIIIPLVLVFINPLLSSLFLYTCNAELDILASINMSFILPLVLAIAISISFSLLDKDFHYFCHFAIFLSF